MTGTIGAMLRFIPCSVSGLLCNILVAKVIHLVPGQLLICIGIAATGLSNVFFAIAGRDAIYWGLPVSLAPYDRQRNDADVDSSTQCGCQFWEPISLWPSAACS